MTPEPPPNIANGYRWHLSPASQRSLGGIGIAVLLKPSLRGRTKSLSPNHLHVACDAINIITCYFPPNTDVGDIIFDVTEVLSEIDPTRPTLLCGDFNCRTDKGKRGQTLSSELANLGFHLANNPYQPTYRSGDGRSCIDLTFWNGNPGQMDAPTVDPSPLRKHKRVFFTITGLTGNRQQAEPVKIKRVINIDALMKNENMQRAVEHAGFGYIDSSVYHLNRAILEAAPVVNQKTHHHKPWYDKQCKIAKERLRDSDRRGDTAEYKKLAKGYRKLLKEKRKDHEEKVMERKLKEAEHEPWKLFKKHSATAPSEVEHDVWMQHFSALLDPHSVPPDLTIELGPTDSQDYWFNQPFSETEVERAINRAPVRKAAGPDRITYEHLKGALPVIRYTTTLLFNAILSKMTVPRVWKTSIMKILFKGKGSKTDPNNYRGISLLDCLYKVLTHLLNNRLLAHLSEMLPPEQYGFRQGRGTSTPIRILKEEIQDALSTPKGHMYGLFIDFRKAFDCVNRTLLTTKLKEQFGVQGLTLGLIRAILSWNELLVHDGFSLSDPITQHRGVQQGDSLSPTLFILYVADLADRIREAGVRFLFYADDLVLISRDRAPIQKALSVIEEWCQENGIDLNVDKTKAVKFRRGGRLCNDDSLKFGRRAVEFVSAYEYLGVTFQSRLTFTEHVSKKKRKALSITAAIKELRQVSITCANKIFAMKILPSIIYGLDVISENLTLPQLLTLDQAKTAFWRKVLGVHKCSSATMVHEMVNSPTLTEDLKSRGYVINDNVWKLYMEQKEDRLMNLCCRRYTDAPVFQFDEWKRSGEKNRHFFTRASIHGFHHLLCSSIDCFDPQDGCVCQFCEESASDLYHLEVCAARLGNGIPQFVRFMDSVALT